MGEPCEHRFVFTLVYSQITRILMKIFLAKIQELLRKFAVPFVLFFSVGAGVTYWDRIKYFFQAVWLSFPFIVVYNHLVKWHQHNSFFIESASVIIFINAIFGGVSHWKQGTFSWKDMAVKNFMIVFIVLSSYLVLEKLFSFFSSTFVGDMLHSSISFMTLMYPASKFMTSAFIITNGKFPPEFLMKLFYSYEKNGRLKDFFDLLQGEGIKTDENFEEFKNKIDNETKKEQTDD